jgi:hypothetical protein
MHFIQESTIEEIDIDYLSQARFVILGPLITLFAIVESFVSHFFLYVVMIFSTLQNTGIREWNRNIGNVYIETYT